MLELLHHMSVKTKWPRFAPVNSYTLAHYDTLPALKHQVLFHRETHTAGYFQ